MATLIKYSQDYTDLNNINKDFIGKTVTIIGTIRALRTSADRTFVDFVDGSTSKATSLMTEDKELMVKLKTLCRGASLGVTGEVVKHPVKDDLIEIIIKTIFHIGPIADPVKYILNAKGASLDVLRAHKIARMKSITQLAVQRIRAGVSTALYTFFQMIGFKLLNPNVVTTADCEGGGEQFTITTQIKKDKEKLEVDFSKDFFLKPAFLTVSSQLQLESLAHAFMKVWTCNKSFRAEKSKTSRHVGEFEHYEWETVYVGDGLTKLLDLNEHITQFCIGYILEIHMDDLIELDKFVSKGIINKMKSHISKPYVRISYDEALSIITDRKAEIKIALEELPKWGDDLGSICEMFLAEKVYDHPVLVYNYPKDLKSFYMKQNDDGRTVQSCDLLFPGLGEVIGSSVRENVLDKLLKVMEERKMDVSTLQWYVDLRKDGSLPTFGAGLGFDRLVRICTGMENIRDVIPFPVAYEECDY
jgi:asparaginyl-tRNA synthetase